MPLSRTLRLIAFALTLFSFTASSLAAQQMQLPAQSLAPAAAGALAFAIPAGDFSLKLNPTVFSATTRQSGVAIVTITPINGFSEPVSFSCSDLPAGASCSFTPPAVTPAGAPITTTLTVTYAKPLASLRHAPSPLLPASAIACVLLCFGWKKRRPLVLCLLAAGFLGLCAGCGTSNQSLHTTTVTLTASSGSLQHSTTFLLTVE